jgi:hypothetical protein
MSSIGRILSRHRSNSALSVITIAFGLVLLVCTAFLFSIKDKANPEGASLIQNTIIGCAIAGAILIALGCFIRGRLWVLGEHGVQGQSSRGSETWLYREIVETCQFHRSGVPVGLAWRKNGQNEWAAVNAHLSGYRRFFDTLMQGYLQTRVPALLDELERGQVVSFKVLTVAGQIQKNLALGVQSYVNASTTDSVRLSRSTLHLSERDIPIAHIKDVEVSPWTSEISFLLRDGSHAEIGYTALFDMELLLAALDKLMPSAKGTAA